MDTAMDGAAMEDKEGRMCKCIYIIMEKRMVMRVGMVMRMPMERERRKEQKVNWRARYIHIIHIYNTR